MKPITPLSARRLTAYYISALLILAGLTVVSHLVLTYVLHQNHGTAAIINVSGRQRMLSQRIASLAAEYRLGDQTALPALTAAINEFDATEATLSAANLKIMGGDSETRAVRDIYAGGAQSLDAEVTGFVADARKVASLPPGDPASSAALSRVFAAARSPLLTKLNDIVGIHQRETERVLSELEILQLTILGIVLLTLAVEALAIFRPMIGWIVAYTSEMVRLATIDPLTELHNRRGFLERCEVERARALRHGHPLCLLMLDADHFKRINDTYGHDAGDAVLRAMSGYFREVLRATDVAGRLGGEEFAVLLPDTGLPGAIVIAERLRAKIAESAVAFGPHRINVTVSIGVTAVDYNAGGVEKALHDADELMYRAKRSGRDSISSAETVIQATQSSPASPLAGFPQA